MSFEKLISLLKISFCSHNYFYQALYIGAPTFFLPFNQKKPSKMGKAPTWLTKEREVVALAWLVHATNDGIQGCDQKGEDYRNKIHALFKALSPKDAPQGRFGDRPPKAVYVFLRDNSFPDVNKFNEALRLIQASHPTGVNEDNILSMAIALHLGETKRMDYNFRSFDHSKWPNYTAWKILRSAPKFRPPSMASLPMNNDPADATMVDLTNQVPLIVSTSDSKTVKTPITSRTLDQQSLSTETLLCQTDELLEQRHINDLKCLYPAVAHHLPSIDPSRGGRGAAMGNKKAKMEYKKNMVDTEKYQRIDRIEKHTAKQTKQQEELQQVFKLCQLMKLAQAMKNQRLFKKVEDKIEKKLVPTMVNTAEHDEDTTTIATTEDFDGDFNNEHNNYGEV
jgi:hypothetical protein